MKQINSLELARLSAENHSPTDIAGILGVTTSAITQALQQEDVQKLKEDFQLRTDAKVFDDKYDSLEARVASLLERKIATEGMSLKIRELTQTVQLLNGLKRRTGIHSGNSQGTGGSIVQINMPVRITQQSVVVSPRGEILEIDGRPMETIQPSNLRLMAQQATQAAAMIPADLL